MGIQTDLIIPIIKIGRTYGFRGELHCNPLCESIKKSKSYVPWYIKMSSKDRWEKLKDESIRFLKNKALIRFDSIKNKECASIFSNSLIGVNRKSLPFLNAGEFYYSDLIGLDVINDIGDSFGRVSYLIQTGDSQVLVCESKIKKYLIPFVNFYVLEVDLNLGQIITNWKYSYS